MGTALYNLRETLLIHQDDMAAWLERSRGLVSQYERGLMVETMEVRQRFNQLKALVDSHDPSQPGNPWIDESAQRAEASAWLESERPHLLAIADVRLRDLQLMEATYTRQMRVMSIYAQALANSHTGADLREWIQTVLPRLKKEVQKNSPMEQLKLRMDRAALMARAGVEV